MNRHGRSAALRFGDDQVGPSSQVDRPLVGQGESGGSQETAAADDTITIDVDGFAASTTAELFSRHKS